MLQVILRLSLLTVLVLCISVHGQGDETSDADHDESDHDFKDGEDLEEDEEEDADDDEDDGGREWAEDEGDEMKAENTEAQNRKKRKVNFDVLNNPKTKKYQYGFSVGSHIRNKTICPTRKSIKPFATVGSVIVSTVQRCMSKLKRGPECELKSIQNYKPRMEKFYKLTAGKPTQYLYNLQGITQDDLYVCLIFASCLTRKGKASYCPNPCRRKPCNNVANAVQNGGCFRKFFGLYEHHYRCLCKPTYKWHPLELKCTSEASYNEPDILNLADSSDGNAALDLFLNTTIEETNLVPTVPTVHRRVKRWDALMAKGKFKKKDWKKQDGICDNPKKSFQELRRFNLDMCAETCLRLKNCISFVYYIPKRSWNMGFPTCRLKDDVCRRIKKSGFLMYVYTNIKRKRLLSKPNWYKRPGWTAWGEWGKCLPKCSNYARYKNRFRKCRRKPCHGSSFLRKKCKKHECPVRGFWSGWSKWSSCDVTCNGGKRHRTRKCNKNTGGFREAPCWGKGKGVKPCNPGPCPTLSKAEQAKIDAKKARERKRKRMEMEQRRRAEKAEDEGDEGGDQKTTIMIAAAAAAGIIIILVIVGVVMKRKKKPPAPDEAVLEPVPTEDPAFY